MKDNIIMLTGVMEGTGGDKPIQMEYLKLIQEQALVAAKNGNENQIPGDKRITLLIRYDGASVAQAQSLYDFVQQPYPQGGGPSIEGGLPVDVIFLPTNTARLQRRLPGERNGPGPQSYENCGVNRGLSLPENNSNLKKQGTQSQEIYHRAPQPPVERELYHWELNGKLELYDPFAASGRWGAHIQTIAEDNPELLMRLNHCQKFLIIPHAHLVGAKDLISIRNAGLNENAEICLISFLERRSPSQIDVEILPSSINEQITFIDNAVGIARIFPKIPDLQTDLVSASQLLAQIGVDQDSQISPCYMNYEKDAKMCNPKFSDYVQLIKHELTDSPQKKTILAMGAKNDNDVNYLATIAQSYEIPYRIFETQDNELVLMELKLDLNTYTMKLIRWDHEWGVNTDGNSVPIKMALPPQTPPPFSDAGNTELCIIKGSVPQTTLHQMFVYGCQSGGIVGATGEGSTLEAIYGLKLPIFYQCASWMKEFQKGLIEAIPSNQEEYEVLSKWYNYQSDLSDALRNKPNESPICILNKMKNLLAEPMLGKLKLQSEQFAEKILQASAEKGRYIAKEVAKCVVFERPVSSLANDLSNLNMVTKGIASSSRAKTHEQQGVKPCMQSNSDSTGAFALGSGASPLSLFGKQISVENFQTELNMK